MKIILFVIVGLLGSSAFAGFADDPGFDKEIGRPKVSIQINQNLQAVKNDAGGVIYYAIDLERTVPGKNKPETCGLRPSSPGLIVSGVKTTGQAFLYDSTNSKVFMSLGENLYGPAYELQMYFGGDLGMMVCHTYRVPTKAQLQRILGPQITIQNFE